jgi:HPt (histidine-containing phosphotransfer) domain-containing protein
MQFRGKERVPFRAPELFDAIEHGTPARSGKSPPRDDEPDGPAYDVRAALRATGGDRGLLDEIVRLFLDDAPRLREQIREAIGRRDAKALRSAAHSLRGGSSHFAAPSITEAAKLLELSAQSEDFAAADAARAKLEPALDRVLAALSESLAQPSGI